MTAKKTALIYNPSAGGGKANRKKKKVEALLAERQVEYDLFLTESEEHLIKTAMEVVAEYPLIIGAGGDTTINIIAREILRAKTNNTLAIIGLGSVNDLSRELGVFKLEHAVDAIQAQTKQAVDMGVVSSSKKDATHYFLVSGSVGLGVTVNRYVDIWMRKHPLFASIRSATQSTAAVKGVRHSFKNKEVPLQLKLETQGKIYDIESPLIVFCNTSSFGGSFHPSPYASVVSGKLDCCILHASSFTNFFKVSIDVKRQKHLIKENVDVLRSDRFKIHGNGPLEFQMDGDIKELDGDIEISVLPGALNMIVNPDHSKY